LREEVEKRVLRILINFSLIVAIVLVLSFLDISLPYIIDVIPKEGFTLTIAVSLLVIIVLFFTALRVILDLTKLIDMASVSLLRHMPGFNPENSSSIIRALKELMLVFIMAITVSIASPIIISSLPEVGGWLGLAISIICLALSLALIYDAGKTLYSTFESSIQLLIDRITNHYEKREEPYKES